MIMVYIIVFYYHPPQWKSLWPVQQSKIIVNLKYPANFAVKIDAMVSPPDLSF